MTKFESRPSKVALWEYLFFVDIEGHRDDANVAAALEEVATHRGLPQGARLLSRGGDLMDAHAPRHEPRRPRAGERARDRALRARQADRRDRARARASPRPTSSRWRPTRIRSAPRPKALAAIRGALDVLHYYPGRQRLRAEGGARAQASACAPENIVLGNGSNDVLELVARAFLTRGGLGGRIRSTRFMVYPLVVQAIGARAHRGARARLRRTTSRRWRAASAPDTKIVFLANPNNPTGTFLPVGRGARASSSASRRTCIVVLDEAYGEYLPDALRVAHARRGSRSFPNLVVSRTLSKAYGLAGLRVGFGIAHPRGGRGDEPRAPAVQREPPGDGGGVPRRWTTTTFIEESRAVNAAGLAQLAARLRAARPRLHPVVRQLHHRARGRRRPRLRARCCAEGVIVRPIAGYGMPEHLRVTVGLPEHNARFLAALERARRRPEDPCAA